MSTQSTPIQKLLIEEEEEKKLQVPQSTQSSQQETQQYPVQQMAAVAPLVQNHVQQNKKEFFGLKDFDYKSTVLVSIILFTLTSSIFTTLLRTFMSGSFGPDGRITLIGTAIATIIGTLIFVIAKFFLKI